MLVAFHTAASLGATAVSLILNVTPQQQVTDVWCWAAASSMTVEYVTGEPVRQCELVTEHVGEEIDCCATVIPQACLRPALQEDISRLMVHHGLSGQWVQERSEIFVFEALKGSQKPLMIHLQGEEGRDHAVLITGLLPTGDLMVVDPLEGVAKPMSFDELSNYRARTWHATFVFDPGL